MNRKTKAIIVAAILIVVIIGAIVYFLSKAILFQQMAHTEQHLYDIEHFSEYYKDDFETVADLTKQFFETDPAGKTDDYRLRYFHIGCGSDPDTAVMYYYYAGDDGAQKTLELALTAEQKTAVQTICSMPANSNESFSLVRYYDDQISFCMETNLQYSVVYTFSGDEPRYIGKQMATSRLSITRIDEHWFHVRTTS